MLQAHKQRQTIERVIESSLPIYLELLGYTPEETRLKQIPIDAWNKFVLNSGLKHKSSGVFLPRSQTATIISGDVFGLFHEYFGHGLFCEQSILGRHLVNLEKELLSQEKEEYKDRQFCKKDLIEFRTKNKTFNEILDLNDVYLDEYESFALWSEYFLSNKHNLGGEFEKRYDLLSLGDKSNLDNIVNFSRRYGELATFYAQGMSKKINPKRVTKLLKEVYLYKLDSVKLALIYGSRKEFSDIDVLLVSEDAPEIDSWLDVTVYSPEVFEKKINSLDIAVTNPLMTSEFLFGDKGYFEACKKKVLYSPITSKSIKHSLTESFAQELLAKKFPNDSKDYAKGLRYSLSYLASALALKNGLRIFELNELLLYLHKQVPTDGKIIEIQGGAKYVA